MRIRASEQTGEGDWPPLPAVADLSAAVTVPSRQQPIERTAIVNTTSQPEITTWDIGAGAFYDRLSAAHSAVRQYGPEGTDVLLEALHPNTTFTVCAYVFNPARTRTLLVEHPKFGWVPAGGHVEGIERPAVAARRELHEETGVEAALWSATPAVLSYASAARLGMVGFVAYVSETHLLTPETEAAWFDLDDLPSSKFPDDPARIRQAAADVPPATGPFRVRVTHNDHTGDEVASWDNLPDLEDALRLTQTCHHAYQGYTGAEPTFKVTLRG